MSLLQALIGYVGGGGTQVDNLTWDDGDILLWDDGDTLVWGGLDVWIMLLGVWNGSGVWRGDGLWNSI